MERGLVLVQNVKQFSQKLPKHVFTHGIANNKKNLILNDVGKKCWFSLVVGVLLQPMVLTFNGI